MIIGMGRPNNHSRIPRPIFLLALAQNAPCDIQSRWYEHILGILRSTRAQTTLIANYALSYVLQCRKWNRIPPVRV
jgi:hypothetical protein